MGVPIRVPIGTRSIWQHTISASNKKVASNMSQCRACGLDHSPRENCGIARRKAEYIASQTAPTDSTIDDPVIDVVIPLPTKEQKQRWARDAYNAYMRDYMKKKRAVCLEPESNR